MTILTTTNKVRIEGNGVTTVFNFSFRTRVITDLQVYKVERATESATLQTYGTHYTASINPTTEGGSVTFVTAPAATEDVVIIRTVTFTQTTEFPAESELPETAFEEGLDKAMMAAQQVDEKIGRALLFGTTSPTSGKTLPEPMTGRALEWGASGNIVNSTASLSDILAGAQAARTAAETARAAAETAQTGAQTARANAETAETNAEAAQTAAEAARNTTVNFVNRGVWLDTTAYTLGNLVGYTKADGRFGTYMALQASTGQNPETSSGYWVLVAQDGVSEIQFRKDITFSATFDTVQEMKDNGMITNYTSATDPLYFPATSSNAYQFAQANIVSGGKFGNCLDFTQTAKSLLLPEKNVDLSGIFSLSFWIKCPAVANRTVLFHTSRGFSIATTSTGTICVAIATTTTSLYANSTTVFTSGTSWRNVIVRGRFNSGSSTDFLEVWVDGVKEGSGISGTSLTIVGLDCGRVILGAGYVYDAAIVNTGMSVLPSASTPAWTFSGTSESTDCSVTNGVLRINTLGGSGGTATAAYTISDGANWTVTNATGYFLEIKCKIMSNSTAPLAFVIGDGTKYSNIYLYPTYLRSYGDEKFFYLDATKYHTYRLAVKGDVYWVWIDGVLALTGQPRAAAVDRIQFGDTTNDSGLNLDAYIDYVRYFQGGAYGTTYIGAECDTYIDDFAVFNTNITASDIAALQLASVTALQTFVDGSGITNIGRSHIALQELIDERDYEENIAATLGGYCAGSIRNLVSTIQFSTKKRILPTIVFSTTGSMNLSTITALAITLTGFSYYITATAEGYAYWTGAWQAQCASKTKIENITNEGFDLVIGTPITDMDGEVTGYSTERVAVSHDDIEISKDEKVMTIRKGNVVVCMPTNNKLQELTSLGYTDQNLSVQACKLISKKKDADAKKLKEGGGKDAAKA